MLSDGGGLYPIRTRLCARTTSGADNDADRRINGPRRGANPRAKPAVKVRIGAALTCLAPCARGRTTVQTTQDYRTNLRARSSPSRARKITERVPDLDRGRKLPKKAGSRGLQRHILGCPTSTTGVSSKKSLRTGPPWRSRIPKDSVLGDRRTPAKTTVPADKNGPPPGAPEYRTVRQINTVLPNKKYRTGRQIRPSSQGRPAPLRDYC